MYANNHTRLMNKFIGLCDGSVGWPSPLGGVGYEVNLIEKEVTTDSARKVVPDMIACSQSLAHAIVVECKSGSSLDTVQDEKYREVKAANIAKVVSINKERLTHTVSYVADNDKYESLRRGTSLPFIVFGDDYVEGRGDFKREELDRALQKTGIRDKWAEPTNYYAFSHDEAAGVIVMHAINGLITCAKNGDPGFKFDLGDEGTIVAILKRTHVYYSRISTKHRRELKGRVRKVLDQIARTNPDFARQFAKMGQKPGYAAVRKFHSICERIVEDYAAQDRLD